jgi:hypothetical protein
LTHIQGCSAVKAPILGRRSSTAVAKPAADAANEWGVYDPAVAGMEAVFARVDPEGLRRTREAPVRRSPRRKAARRDKGGVGLAIKEAVARARQESPAALSPAELTEPAVSKVPRADRSPRQPRSRPAIWLRAAAGAPDPRVEHDTIHGIFGTLAVPATVALVQYARGCRIATVHIAGDD